jgi:hypothetical protein
LSGTAVTGAGLDVLHHMPQLRTISLPWTRVSDAGTAALTDCHEVQHVNLVPTGAGGDTLRAFAGKR